jgi:hypothetical protein
MRGTAIHGETIPNRREFVSMIHGGFLRDAKFAG